MPAIRVIVTISAPSAEAAEEALKQRVEICKRTEAEEDGCLQYEVFQSKLRPERFMLVELWASKESFDKHSRLQQEHAKTAPADGSRPLSASVEMYRQALYVRVDGIWQAADSAERMESILWQ